MLGFAGGASCWPSVAEAAAAQCGSVGGVTQAGVVTCDAVVGTTETGATLRYRWTTAASAPTTSESAVELPACERFDVATFWSPLLGVAFLAVITVMCAKAAIRPFRREGL